MDVGWRKNGIRRVVLGLCRAASCRALHNSATNYGIVKLFGYGRPCQATFVEALRSVVAAPLKHKQHPQTFEAAVEALEARYAERDWAMVSTYK